MSRPRRVLMTIDAVGGVWRYGVDLAHALAGRGVACILAGLGPKPVGWHDAPVWSDQPLDWLVGDEAALDGVPAALSELARSAQADLLHLNAASQAAGLGGDLPVVVASHSCVPSWWRTVRGTPLPKAWAWQHRRNRDGLDRADIVLAPSASHARELEAMYGRIHGLRVVRNATDAASSETPKQPFVLAAGRWWDEGKNAAALDHAQQRAVWPIRMAGALTGPGGQSAAIRHAAALGDLSASELRAMMRNCAIFASPSRYEPFGLAVLEAAAQRAALVLSDIPTFRELWSEAAVFVPPDDWDGFAKAINRLADDDALRTRLGREAGRRADALHPARQCRGVLDAYAEAMARRRTGAG